MRPLVIWLGVLGLVVSASANAAREWVVGILPYQPARALITHHGSLAAHLSQAMNYPVRIVTARDSRVFGQRLLAGDYDLALAPAHMARLAEQDRGWHLLARHASSTPVFLLAHQTNPDYTQASLQGKTLAVPDRTMLVTLAGEKWLAQRSLRADRDYTLLVTGGYGSAINALISGRADMALGSLASMGQARAEDVRQLRIVKEIDTIPLLVFAARADIAPATRARLQRALLSYPAQPSNRFVRIGAQDLKDMDPYLPQTRNLLTPLASPALSQR